MVTYEKAPYPQLDYQQISQQKLCRPGGRAMAFLKYWKVKTVSQEYSTQKSYDSDMKENQRPSDK